MKQEVKKVQSDIQARSLCGLSKLAYLCDASEGLPICFRLPSITLLANDCLGGCFPGTDIELLTALASEPAEPLSTVAAMVKEFLALPATLDIQSDRRIYSR